MFGTLVIQLPSNYSGGKLIVYHQGKKSEFDYSGPGCCSNYYYTSFYADCQHEVEKVTKGYRLCLIYNLIYRGRDECPAPADNQKQVSAIVSAVTKWQEDIESDDCPDMMTYLLEHKYCEASLSFQLLKNGDRAVADVLAQAEARVDFDFYVGHVNMTEHWSADHYYGRYKEIECCDETVCIRHLKACDGEHTISEMYSCKDSFVPEDFFDNTKPDAKEYEEATGNEGASIDKQYNWTALLFWPVRKRTAVIGMDNLIQLFKQDVDAGKKGLNNVAREIMREVCHNRPSLKSCVSFLHALVVIADTKLISEMLDVIVGFNDDYCYKSFIEDATFRSSVVSISHKHGWDILKSPLQAMFATCSTMYVESYCTFLKEMITSKELGDEKDLYTNFLSIIVKVLDNEEDATTDGSSSSWWYRGYQARSKEFVIQLFNLLTAVGSNNLFASAVSALCIRPVRYPILETLGPALVDFYKSVKVEKDGPLQEILDYCISELEDSVRKFIAASKTHTKKVNFTCFKSCKDCMELKEFLKHPTKVQHRFSVGKERRQHLHQQLDTSGVDASCTTENFGNPHTLVVTKNNASYEKDFKKQQQERALLASLYPLVSVTDVPSENEPPAKKQKSTSKVVSLSSPHIDLT